MTQAKNQSPNEALTQPNPVSFWEAFLFWLKMGFISFGGPAGQIAIMQQELVEKRRWLSEKRFLHALNYCMLLPAGRPTVWPMKRPAALASLNNSPLH